ncbi:MAG: M20/M25/M40 family metallo-hydrolase [Bacteroidales bacterium]
MYKYAGKYIELLLQLLAIPALSRKEEIRADFLENWLKKEGFTLKRTGNNLVVTGGNNPALSTILLNSHMDTVAPGAGWKSDPFVPLSEEGRITGLGCNDAGASVISMVAAYRNLVERNMADRVVMVISAEEEVSGKNGLSSVIPELPGLKFAVVGEPTSLQPAIAERGLMVVDAVAKGTAGHAARDEGENAIYKAMTDISVIREIVFNRPSEWLPDPSVNVTVIHAGTGHNVVPARCEFIIDVRSNDHYSNKMLLDLLKNRCSSELTPRSLRLNSSFLNKNHPLFELFGKMNLIPFGSPTLSDMALLDIPAVKIGPGDSSRSHSANEYIYISEIEQAVDLYTNLLEEILKLSL